MLKIKGSNMAKTNYERSVVFLSSTSSLPTIPTDFLEVTEALAISATVDKEEFRRISGILGQNDTNPDNCSARIEGTQINHKIREQNAAADALGTAPAFKQLLEISGMDYEVAETLVLSDLLTIAVGDTVTGDTTTATGTVKAIDTVLKTITVGGVTGGPFTAGGEDLNSSAYTAIKAGLSPRFINSQNPKIGSMINNLDGNQHTATAGVIASTNIMCPLGKSPTIEASLSTYLDNEGVSTAVTIPDVSTAVNNESVMTVGCADILSADGTLLTANNVTIQMNPDIANTRGFGSQEFEITNYNIKIVAEFYPENADYALAQTKINAQTKEKIVLKLGLDSNRELVNGKSIEIIIPVAKSAEVSDANDQAKLKRTFTWMAQGGLEQISIKQGFFK
jgi:hypothetical protein